jgi:hypothetical protein
MKDGEKLRKEAAVAYFQASSQQLVSFLGSERDK